jgi:hypothetical protein
MRERCLWACGTPLLALPDSGYIIRLPTRSAACPWGRVCQSPRRLAMRHTMTIPVLREAVSADNNSGGAEDGLRAQQTPHSPVFDRSVVPGNCRSRGSCTDTHWLSLPALLPGGVVSQPLVPGSTRTVKQVCRKDTDFSRKRHYALTPLLSTTRRQPQQSGGR